MTHRPGYLLCVDPTRVDLLRFRNLAEYGRAALRSNHWYSAAVFLREALELWRGPALSDLTEACFSWPELTAVQNERWVAFEDLFHAELARGRHYEIVGELELLVGAEPHQERLCAQLMLALYRCGRQTDALDHYHRTSAARAGAPGPELRKLTQAILNQSPALELPTPIPDGCR